MSFAAVGGIAAGVGAVGAIGKIFTGLHQNHLANQIKPQWQQYQPSKYAGDQLGLAQQLFNGQMPGTSAYQQGIQSAQANYLNNVNRNATDSSQALALANLSQGNSNNATQNLATQQGQYRQSMLGNLNNAYQAMVNEGDKSYQSFLQKYQMDTNTQNGLRNAGVQNAIGGINDLASTGLGFANYQNSSDYLNYLKNRSGQTLNPNTNG